MSNPIIGNAYSSAESTYGQYFAPDADAGDAAESDDTTIIGQLFGAYGAAGSVAPTNLINANSINTLINSGDTSSVAAAASTAASSAAASGDLQLASSYEQLAWDANQGANSQTLQNDLLHVLGVVVTNQVANPGSSSGAAQTTGSDLDQGYIGRLSQDLSDNSQTTGTDIEALQDAIQTGQLKDPTGLLASTLSQFGSDWGNGNSGNYQQDLTAVEQAYAEDNTTSSTNVSGRILSDIQQMESGASAGNWGAVGSAASDIFNLDPNAVGNSKAIQADADWVLFDLDKNQDPTSDIAQLLTDTESANHYTSNTAQNS